MLRSTFSSLREYLTPISHESNFQKTGQLTPEEFVKAGDYLVHKFPTWSWSAASSSKRRDFLPADKQYLVTKHVPCRSRASGSDAGLELVDDGGEDQWVIRRVAEEPTSRTANMAVDVEDLDALGIEDPEGAEDATMSRSSEGALKASSERSYNVYITYSTSYRVPKAYLSGFDADGTPLDPNSMFDDIVGDYKDKTVTIESAPFQSNLTLISIHPCRHAGVMRMLIDMADSKAFADSKAQAESKMESKTDSRAESKVSAPSHTSTDDTGERETDQDDASGGEWEEIPQGIRVDQYLIIFLKFISSVTPTIEYDFTMTAL